MSFSLNITFAFEFEFEFRTLAAYTIFVEDFMNQGIKYIWNGMTYKELRETVSEGRRVRSFPLVDTPSNLKLVLLSLCFT